MMKKREGIGYYIQCDNCQDFFDMKESDFIAATKKYKQEGWLFVRTKGIPLHFCPNCKERK